MVFIGCCDEAVSGYSVASFTENQLGGRPVWLREHRIPECVRCSSDTVLISQIYAPLTVSPLERVIYIFACVAPSCQNTSESWIVIRMTGPPDQQHTARITDKISEDMEDWGVGGVADWGDCETESFAAVLASESEQLTESTTNFSIDTTLSSLNLEDNCTCFIPYYMYIEDEADPVVDIPCDVVMPENESRHDNEVDRYEKTDIPHKDKEFYKFYKRLRQHPEQCIRYDINGTPLLKTTEEQISNCENCQGERVFEFQLMPALLSVLKFKHDNRKSALDFRTIQVYTCKSNCEVAMAKEVAICVPEPELIFKRPPNGSFGS